MKTTFNTIRLIIPICALVLTLGSCNKDTDLVTDYALADTSGVVNDAGDLQTPNAAPVSLDVLLNDIDSNKIN